MGLELPFFFHFVKIEHFKIHLYFQYFIKEKTFKTKKKKRYELEVFFPKKLTFLSRKYNHMEYCCYFSQQDSVQTLSWNKFMISCLVQSSALSQDIQILAWLSQL